MNTYPRRTVRTFDGIATPCFPRFTYGRLGAVGITDVPMVHTIVRRRSSATARTSG